jgi:hypothetical protein
MEGKVYREATWGDLGGTPGGRWNREWGREQLLPSKLS